MRSTAVRSLLVPSLALALAACCCPFSPQGSSTGPTTTLDPPTPPPPTTPPGPGPGPVTISPPSTPPGQPAPPGGGYQVSVGGRNAWPPQGPGCDRYVSCCDAAGAINGAINLSCRLSVATPPVDCGRSLEQVKRMMTEMGVAVPAACN